MLNPELREDLENTGKCKTINTAWGNDKTAYSDYYFENLFKEIDLCLESKSENVVLNRTKMFSLVIDYVWICNWKYI